MITFTRSWRGYAAGTSVSTLADTIEALAVAEGAATYGGVSYPPNSYLDADNRTQALVDTAGNSSLLFRRASANLPQNFTCALFGDSITNSCTTASGSRIDLNTLGYYCYVNALARGRLRLIGEYGYSGYKQSDLLTQVAAVAAANANVYIYEAGTNSAFAYASAAIATETAADETIIRALAATGALVIVVGCPPRTDAVSPAVPAMQAYIGALNTAKRALCAAIPGALYVDWFSALANPATGDWVSGYANVDGVHPIAKGALTAGRAIFDRIDNALGDVRPLDIGAFDFNNLWFNPGLAGANASGTAGFVISAGATGTGPNGQRVQRSGGAISAVLSQVARSSSDLRGGSVLQFAVTGDGTGANSVQVQYRALSAAWTASRSTAQGEAVRPTVPNGYRYVMISANGTGGSVEPTWPTTLGATVTDNNSKTWMCVPDFAAGDIVQVSADVEFSSFSGDFHPTLTLQAVNESSTVLFTSGDLTNVFDTATQPTFGASFQPSMRLVTMPMVLPSGTTRLYMTVGVAAAAGVTGNMKVTGCRAEKVSTAVVQA